MSQKNRFQKHKSRKYRKLYPVPEKQLQKIIPRTEEEQEIKKQKEIEKTEKTKPSFAEKPKKEFLEEVKIKNQNSPAVTKSDLKKVLTTFLAFAILIAGLYIIKIKTSVFEISVNYLYKIMALSH